MACTHLHTSAKQSADIHRYIHTADKQTDRQTYIPIFVLVTLHRHGGGLGRRPLEIVKKTRSFPRASLYVSAFFSGLSGPDELVSHASLYVSAFSGGLSGPDELMSYKYAENHWRGIAEVHASLAQEIDVVSSKKNHITLYCNCKCDAWKAEVEQCSAHKNVVKHVLSFAAGSERSSPTLFSYIGAADECCKCHGEEPLRLHNVLSHRSAVV